MERREFYLQDDQSNKYWTIAVDGTCVVTTNGRIGAKPRETRTDFPTAEQAGREAEKEILAKRRKGYLEGDLRDVPAYQPRLPPRFVRICHDDYHAKYVGKTAGGDQFFMTFPFSSGAEGTPRGNFIALYVFDEFGLLKDARIHSEQALGLKTRTAVDAFAAAELASLGKIKYGDIKVAPFDVEKFGQRFGLVFDPGDPETDEDPDEPYITVTVEPGNYMAFNPPWEGDYDT
jgi:predicted DNA-binding WGR domain protein